MDLITLASIGWKILPRINIGPLAISPHGIGIAVGFALGGVIFARRAERFYGVDKEIIWNSLMYAVVGVIIGARLFYVTGHLDEYANDLFGIFRIWEGGVVFYGGAIGGVIGALPYLRKQGLSSWQMLDAAAPGFPIGLFFGRLGDLAIGDHLGEATTFALGFRYEGAIGCLTGCVPGFAVDPAIGSVFHQTALYDFFSVALLLPLVLWLGRRPHPRGWLMMLVVTWYASARFVTDFARTTKTYFGLHGTQWVSLALIVLGIALLIRRATVALDPVDASGAPSEDPTADDLLTGSESGALADDPADVPVEDLPDQVN